MPGIVTRIHVHLDGTLEIREVRASDVGAYKCIVRSQGGHDERVAHLRIIELPYPPSHVKATKLPKLAPVSRLTLTLSNDHDFQYFWTGSLNEL